MHIHLVWHLIHDRHAWSTKGHPAIVRQSFSRGIRVSALAAFNYSGFCGWKFTRDTFTRQSFHTAFTECILPCLNRYPLPNSIVVIDNARIHMYRELQSAVESRGALLFFLPPYSPQLNPIETGFALLKTWIQRHCSEIFRFFPEQCLDIACRNCIIKEDAGVNLIQHSGYGFNQVDFTRWG